MNIKTTTTEVSVHYEVESPIFGESSIKVSIQDEASGFWIRLSDSTNESHVDINRELLDEVYNTAKKLLAQEVGDK